MKGFKNITDTMPTNLLALTILGNQISSKAFDLSDQSKAYDEDFVKTIANMTNWIRVYVETALPLSLREQYYEMVKEKNYESSRLTQIP